MASRQSEAQTSKVRGRSVDPAHENRNFNWARARPLTHSSDRAQSDARRFAEALALAAGDQWAEVATGGQRMGWLEQHPRRVIALFSGFAMAAAGLRRGGHGSWN
jgi:hypothetical protein